jgi:Protein of unknown function (DUF2865)
MHVSTYLKIASTFVFLLLAFRGDLVAPSHAQSGCDPLALFFGGCHPRSMQQPFGPATEPGDGFGPHRVYVYRPRRESSATAFCVRTCDGRYFPISVRDGQSSAEICSGFCPASETRIYHGSSIDEASTDSGKSYSDMPNAFRYRNELVAGCTCNGKDAFGLAPMKVEDDPTLRKGDIVAGVDGLKVVGRGRRSAEVNLTPAPLSLLRAKFGQIPIVAAQ